MRTNQSLIACRCCCSLAAADQFQSGSDRYSLRFEKLFSFSFPIVSSSLNLNLNLDLNSGLSLHLGSQCCQCCLSPALVSVASSTTGCCRCCCSSFAAPLLHKHLALATAASPAAAAACLPILATELNRARSEWVRIVFKRYECRNGFG